MAFEDDNLQDIILRNLLGRRVGRGSPLPSMDATPQTPSLAPLPFQSQLGLTGSAAPVTPMAPVQENPNDTLMRIFDNFRPEPPPKPPTSKDKFLNAATNMIAGLGAGFASRRRGQPGTGMGAAIQTPMAMAMMKQQQRQEQERERMARNQQQAQAFLQAHGLRLNERQQQFNESARTFDMMQGQPAQELTIPGAQYMPAGNMPAPPVGTRQVPLPPPEVQFPDGTRRRPASAQQLAQLNSERLREEARIRREFAEPEAKGAPPVLNTPIGRLIWNGTRYEPLTVNGQAVGPDVKEPTFEEKRAQIIESGYAESIGKPVASLTSMDKVKALGWLPSLTPKAKNEFQQRLELYQRDPATYNALFGREDKDVSGLDLAGIVQRTLTNSRDITGAIDEEAYEQQRKMISGVLGFELPKYGQALDPRLGKIVPGKDGKQYRIVAIAPDGEPLVEEVQ